MPKYLEGDALARIAAVVNEEFGEQCYFALVYTHGQGIAAALRRFLGQPADGQLNIAANLEPALAVELIKGAAEGAPELFAVQISAFKDRLERAAAGEDPPTVCQTCGGTGKYFNKLLGEDRPCVDCAPSQGNA